MNDDANTVDELTRELRHLRSELLIAREGILQLLPQHVQDLLDSSGCKDRDELVNWRRNTIEKAIDLAVPIQRSEVEMKIDPTPRAYCPLCEADSSGFPWIKGYAVPKGMEMHLDGVGKTRKCIVLYTAFEIGSSRLNEM